MKVLFLFLLFLSSVAAHADCYFAEQSKDAAGNTISDYASDWNDSATAALILPPTGGENIADKILAINLCQRGLNAVILNYRQNVAEITDLSAHDKISKEVLLWIDGLISARDQKFVLIGSSLGSLYTSMAFGVAHSNDSAAFPGLQKIAAIVLTVSGGTLTDVLVTSQLPSVIDQRTQRLQKLGYKDVSEYQKALDAAIHLDPLKSAHPELRDKVLMFSSVNDVIVPTATQFRLWQAWGQPERQLYITDHMWTVALVYFTQAQKIFDFAQQNFAND